MEKQLSTLDDIALLSVVLEGSEAGWCELLSRFRGLIYRCIHKAIGKFDKILPSEAAEEIFSEVCMNLLRNDMKKLRVYDPTKGSKLGSWIGLISINSAYDYLRKSARQPTLDQIDGTCDRQDESAGPLDQLLKRERSATLYEIADELSAKDRHFVELYYARELSPQEIAARMDISVKTVYSKKNKIRKRLLEMVALPQSFVASMS